MTTDQQSDSAQPSADQATAERLHHYTTLTHAGIHQHLAGQGLSPHLYELVRDYPERGGKGIRAALLLATCQAYGRPLEDALPAAVSLEMMHNAFLIHDDVEDESANRRGGPALHELYGIGPAVNAGDSLAQLALEPLYRSTNLGRRLTRTLLSELLMVVRQATEGQALELAWRRDSRTDLSDDDYLDMAGKKTCWYTTVAPLRMGAIIGSAGTASLDLLTRFGYYLGLAFQIRDDLLDADPTLTEGNPPDGDLVEGKRTLMLIHLLSHAKGKDRSWLLDYLARPRHRRTATAAARVYALMHRYESLAYAEDYGKALEAAAEQAFERAFSGVPDSEHRRFLADLVPYMVARRS